MANVRSGNTFYVDTASASATPSSFINKKQILVQSIVFNSNVAGDSITLCDLNSTGTGAGATKLVIKNGVAADAKVLEFNDGAILFPNGIWISAISSSCTAMLLLTDNGN